jgi:type VI secretion system secreted protein VgrG
VYGARFFSPEDGRKLANLRAEELLARRFEHELAGTIPLRAGFQFKLEDHPLGAYNATYLATDVEHFGNLVGDAPDLARRIDVKYRDVYRCEATAMPDKVQFRPARGCPAAC